MSMSVVASKLSRIHRVKSVSLPAGQFNLLCTGTAELNRPRARPLTGTILNPRAPKIRHLNASHALLIELDKHIAKVQELEQTVYELELQLQQREAERKAELAAEQQTKKMLLPDIQQNRLKGCLISEEEQAAFQNRLQEARKRAAQLLQKTSQEEANILRTWHSKKLKQALDAMHHSTRPAESQSLKFLAAPAQVDEEENRIFSCLNAMVDIANSRVDLDSLEQLLLQREDVHNMLMSAQNKLERAARTVDDCLNCLSNFEASRSALQVEMAGSTVLLGNLLQPRHRQQSSFLWIYGPNPIFAGHVREMETAVSFQAQFITEMMKKMDMSRIQAEENLKLARRLVSKYTGQVDLSRQRLEQLEAVIDSRAQAVIDQNPPPSTTVVQEVLETTSSNEDLDATNIKMED